MSPEPYDAHPAQRTAGVLGVTTHTRAKNPNRHVVITPSNNKSTTAALGGGFLYFGAYAAEGISEETPNEDPF
jgi:hypothetical protein